MAPWLISLIAAVSTAACFFLWFRDVRRIMLERASTVESAGRHLAVCREKAHEVRGTPEAAAILARSEDIYQQAVDHYNRTIRKPWVYIPAVLMRFKPIPREQERMRSEEG